MKFGMQAQLNPDQSWDGTEVEAGSRVEVWVKPIQN